MTDVVTRLCHCLRKEQCYGGVLDVMCKLNCLKTCLAIQKHEGGSLNAILKSRYGLLIQGEKHEDVSN